jgi:hypothetical protein
MMSSCIVACKPIVVLVTFKCCMSNKQTKTTDLNLHDEFVHFGLHTHSGADIF